MKSNLIPVIIPAYEPDEKLILLLNNLKETGISPVVVVDDGSDGEKYQKIFEEIETQYPFTVLHHAVNMGKGRALKTAFNYCLIQYPQILGCVTIDSDGQHTISDMIKCMEALTKHPQALILGTRNFNEKGIPYRSLFGNKFTSKVMKLLSGISVSDTQTGLRAIPFDFMKRLLNEKGERYEFETNMLLDTKDDEREIIEVPIQTIYIEENETSHFNPLKDSIRIYAVFFKFIFSSLSSSVVDLLTFTFFCYALCNIQTLETGYILLATIFARILSATYNFLINYKIVFKSRKRTWKTILRYALLAVAIMLVSGLSVTHLHTWIPVREVLIKIPVDLILFLVSFFVQREFVYK